jgi:hypothetical protein
MERRNTSESAGTPATRANKTLTSERLVRGKKYVIRSVCTGNNNKSARETLLELAERKAAREMGF